MLNLNNNDLKTVRNPNNENNNLKDKPTSVEPTSTKQILKNQISNKQKINNINSVKQSIVNTNESKNEFTNFLLNYFNIDNDEYTIFLDDFNNTKNQTDFIKNNTQIRLETGLILNPIENTKKIEKIRYSTVYGKINDDQYKDKDFDFSLGFNIESLSNDNNSKLIINPITDVSKSLFSIGSYTPYKLMPLTIFVPLFHYVQGPLSSGRNATYCYQEQDDNKKTSDSLIKIKIEPKIIKDLCAEIIFSGNKNDLIDLTSDNVNQIGFTIGLNFSYNPKDYLITFKADSYENIAFSLSRKIGENVNVGAGLSYYSDYSFNSESTGDTNHSRIQYGVFGNYNNLYWNIYGRDLDKLEKKTNPDALKTYVRSIDYGAKIFQTGEKYDLGVGYFADNYVVGYGYKNKDSGIYSQIKYDTYDNRLHGFLNFSNCDLLNPFLSFDCEIDNKLYPQRFLIGSNTFYEEIDFYNRDLVLSKDLNYTNSQLETLLRY